MGKVREACQNFPRRRFRWCECTNRSALDGTDRSPGDANHGRHRGHPTAFFNERTLLTLPAGL